MKKLGLLTIIVLVFGSVSFGQNKASKTDNLTEARARFVKNDFAVAIQYFTKCIETDTIKFPCYGERGDVYRRQYKLDLALADYTKAVELAPSITASQLKDVAPKPKYLSKIGEIYMSKFKPDEAIVSFEKALTIDPEFYEALVGIGTAWFSKDRKKTADYFNKAITLKPNLPRAYYEIGTLFLILGTENDYKQAYQYFTKAIVADPKFPDSYYDRYLVQKYGNPDQSKAAAEGFADISKYVELAPDQDRGYNTRGLIYSMEMRKYPEAIADFNKAIALAPSEENYYKNRAEAFIAIKSFQNAINDMTKYLELSKDLPYYDLRSILEKRAESYVLVGNKAAAIKDYETIMQQRRLLSIQEKRNVLLNGERKIMFRFSGNDKADYEKLLSEFNAGISIGEKNVGWILSYESKNKINPK